MKRDAFAAGEALAETWRDSLRKLSLPKNLKDVYITNRILRRMILIVSLFLGKKSQQDNK